MALCADAVIGNVQEKAMRTYDAPNGEVVSLDIIAFGEQSFITTQILKI